MPSGRKQGAGPGKLGPVTIGIAGAVGTSGIGIIVARLASGQGSTMDVCLMLAGSFITTSLAGALGLVLNYQLEKLKLQVQDSAARRSAELRKTRLELQRAIIENVRDGTKAAHAYQEMTAADALYALSQASISTDEPCTPSRFPSDKDR
jgi:hypothetical protein